MRKNAIFLISTLLFSNISIAQLPPTRNPITDGQFAIKVEDAIQDRLRKGCENLPLVKFSLNVEKLEKNNTLSYAQIKSYNPSHGVFMGMYNNDTAISANFKLGEYKVGEYYCTYLKDITLKLNVKPFIYSASEIKDLYCLNAKVLNHEESHHFFYLDAIYSNQRALEDKLTLELKSAQVLFNDINAEQYFNNFVRTIVSKNQIEFLQKISALKLEADKKIDNVVEVSDDRKSCPRSELIKLQERLYMR